MIQSQYDKVIRSVDEWNGWRNTGNVRPSREGKRATREDTNDADLSYADFSNIDLKNADFTGVNLSCANLSGADLSDCTLSNAKLQFIEYNDETKWPANFTLPDTARRTKSSSKNQLFNNSSKLQNKISESGVGRKKFEDELITLFSIVEVTRRALPERPNDETQQGLLEIINMLLQKLTVMQRSLDENNVSIKSLKEELDDTKADANRTLIKFMHRSSDSVADHIGPTLKWLITTGGVAAIAAESLKAALS